MPCEFPPGVPIGDFETAVRRRRDSTRCVAGCFDHLSASNCTTLGGARTFRVISRTRRVTVGWAVERHPHSKNLELHHHRQLRGQDLGRDSNKCSVRSNTGNLVREGATAVAAPLRPTIDAIEVPIALLFEKRLTPAAKRLWMRLALDEQHPRPRSRSSKKLAKRTGVARSTVFAARRRGVATGWLVPVRNRDSGRVWWRSACPAKGSGFVRIPVDLIRDIERIRPQEVLCYGFLQLVPSFNGLSGEFRWAELRRLTRLHMRTLRRAVRSLAEASWIDIKQKNRLAPIWYRLQHADEARLDETRRRLEDRTSRQTRNQVGEAIMHEALALIVGTDQCVEGARPDFLVNPATGERLELDRYYPKHHVAFEFNGPQHYVATDRFPKKVVEAQRRRDAVKRRICKRYGIDLVIVRAEDLGIATLLRKVGDRLPRRSLRIFRQTIRYLNKRAVRYRQAASEGKRHPHKGIVPEKGKESHQGRERHTAGKAGDGIEAQAGPERAATAGRRLETAAARCPEARAGWKSEATSGRDRNDLRNGGPARRLAVE